MSATQADRPEIWRGFSNIEELNYQRRGKRGVDYDEYGAEMEPNARVWGVYVDETDKADKELVEGWNGAMDVMLVFAALYSTILTAFVIESSKDLKPDYSEISARALLTISRTLLSPVTAPGNQSGASRTDISDFVPTTAAVMVNTLWFLSLGLSIAVTLIAILAKEWCYSFMTRRTGAKLIQGRLRQKRWDGIRYWKMEGIICMLPLLMHIALLLFAIGLAIYLWNINSNVALPVVLTTILTVLYYTITAFLPLFFKYCPYTTALVKLFHPLWTAVFKSIYSRALFQMLIMTPAWLLLHILDFKNRVSGKKSKSDENLENGSQIELRSANTQKTLHDHVQEFEKRFYHRIEKMHKDFLIDRSQPGEDDTPMDEGTSAMLLWMITNCEDPKSVDLTLQALAGADPWLPCEIFLGHEIDFQVLRKLERYLYVLESPHLGSDKTAWEELLNNAYLYSRALATLLRGTPANSKMPGVSWNDWKNCMRKLQKILDDTTNTRRNRGRISQSTDFEFGTLLLDGSPVMYTHSSDDFYTKQRKRQWEILEQITTKQVAGLPPSAASVRALVNVIAGTLLYAPRSPLPLVDLFNAYNINLGNEVATLGHAIGIALTVARFTDPRLAPVRSIREDSSSSGEATSASSNATVSRPEHARKVYEKLTTKQPTQRRTRALLTFGLLGLLDYPTITDDHPSDTRDHKQTMHSNYLTKGEIQRIEKALNLLEIPQRHPRESTLLMHEDRHFRYLGYHKLMPLTPPTFDLEAQFEPMVMKWLGFWVGSPRSGTDPDPPGQDIVAMYLEALLSPSRCRMFGRMIVDEMITLILRSSNTSETTNRRLTLKVNPLAPRAKKLCMRSITYSVADWPGCSKRQKQELQTVMTKLIGAGIPAEMISLIPERVDETKNSDKELCLITLGWLLSYTPLLHPAPVLTSVWDVGFEITWFRLLGKLCDDDPVNVHNSGVLEELAKVRDSERNRAIGHWPTSADIQSIGLPASGNERQVTWPEVYERLREKCETAAASREPLSIEVQGMREDGDEPTIASPRSRLEQPFGIAEQGAPLVQESSSSK